MRRTRIKICGLTREADVDAAVDAGADAIGLVFYPRSPRVVEVDLARRLIERLPPFVTAVGLFVNEDAARVQGIAVALGLGMLQFHGDETPDYCAQFSLPWLRAARVTRTLDLLEFANQFSAARGILLDAHVEGYGGGGEVFDWSLVPRGLAPRAVLSGGLRPANVGEGIRALKPAAVDVSSGVEVSKGIKDAALIHQFVAAVRAADASEEA
ncbi:MAG: phosphoribosylanthranilate isomerase [Burkholderiales bacterium]